MPDARYQTPDARYSDTRYLDTRSLDTSSSDARSLDARCLDTGTRQMLKYTDARCSDARRQMPDA
jgi:hypothetical protein